MADVEAEPMEEPVADEEEDIEVEEEEEYVAVGGVTEVKLFGKWSFDDIEVRDISLVVSRKFCQFSRINLSRPRVEHQRFVCRVQALSTNVQVSQF